jgi:FHS family L-fucose permease-like MFS transporter
MAQAFNPIGSLCGMYVAMNFIQNRLDPLDTAQRAQLSAEQFEAVKDHDLSVLIAPYFVIGIIIIAMLILIRCMKMPTGGDGTKRNIDFVPTLRRIFHIRKYREGVIAQFFYVGAQIMCWTFIIQYGTRVFMAEGMSEQAAEVLSQRYNIVAMVLFCVSRFVCTFMLKYINPGRLLAWLAICAALLTCGVIGLQNVYGLYCLVGVSACMSLMFPTIYGIALNGLGDDAKFGAAGLIMAILGGSVLPPLQASIIDQGTMFGIPAVNASFAMPLICFIVVWLYGHRTSTLK